MQKNKFYQAIHKGEKNNPPEPSKPGNKKARFENPPMKIMSKDMKKQKVDC